MTVKKNSITTKTIDQIIAISQQIQFGSVTLTTQNFRLIQIERQEKIRPDDLAVGITSTGGSLSRNDLTAIRRGIREACEQLEYGQVVIVIKNGKIVQMERTEKQRFPSLIGVNGDGI